MASQRPQSNHFEPARRTEARPCALAENQGIAFNGYTWSGIRSRSLGSGILDCIHPENAEVLKPYLNGKDLNTSPDFSPSRWVINFGDRSEAEAGRYRLPFQRLKETVYLERQKNNRKAYRDYWWRYAENRPAMRRAITHLESCIAIRQSSNTLMPVLVSTDRVIDQTIVVFATSSMSVLGVLSSSMHYVWAATHGLRTMAGVLRYTPSDVFDTFRCRLNPRLCIRWQKPFISSAVKS